MYEENYFRNYPSEVTTVLIIHDYLDDATTMITTKEDSHRRRTTKVRKEKLQKWIMRDIASSGSKRELELSAKEHELFIQALKTEQGKQAISELKSNRLNKKVNEVVDVLSDKVIKSKVLKDIWALLKTEDLEVDSTRSPSITSRDMYDFLVEKGIIKINQPINV